MACKETTLLYKDWLHDILGVMKSRQLRMVLTHNIGNLTSLCMYNNQLDAMVILSFLN
jgi:hypothetical protein